MAYTFSFSKFEADYERYSPPRQAKSSFISLKTAWDKNNMTDVRRHAGTLDVKMKDSKRAMPPVLVRHISFLKKCEEKPKVKKSSQNASADTSGASEKELKVSGSGLESPTVKLPPLKSAETAATKSKDDKQISPRRVRNVKELEERLLFLEKWIRSTHEGLQADGLEGLEPSGTSGGSGARPGKTKPANPLQDELDGIVTAIRAKHSQLSEESKRLKKDLKQKEEQISLTEKKMQRLNEDIKAEKIEVENHAPKTNRKLPGKAQTERTGGTTPDIVTSIRETLLRQKETHAEKVSGLSTELRTKVDRLNDLEKAVNKLSEDIVSEDYKKEETTARPKETSKKKQGAPQKRSPEVEHNTVRQVVEEIKKHLRQRDTQFAAEMDRLKEETKQAKERLEVEAGTRDIKTKQFGRQLQDDNRTLQKTLLEREAEVEVLGTAIDELHGSLDTGKAADAKQTNSAQSKKRKQTTQRSRVDVEASKLKDVQKWWTELQERMAKTSSRLQKRDEELKVLQALVEDIHGSMKPRDSDSKPGETLKEHQTSRTASHEKDFVRMLNDMKSQLRNGQEKMIKEKTFDVEHPLQKDSELEALKGTVERLTVRDEERQKAFDRLDNEKSELEDKLASLKQHADSTDTAVLDMEQSKKLLEAKVKDMEHQLQEKEKANDTLKNRLSEALGDKVTVNNPSVVDLSDEHRPTKLSEQFSELYANEWTTALETVMASNDETKEPTPAQEKHWIDMLLAVLKEAYVYCVEIGESQLIVLDTVLHSPVQVMTSKMTTLSNSKLEHSVNAGSIFDIRKRTSNTSSSHVKTSFLRKVKKEKRLEAVLSQCPDYVGRCVELCWLMVLQAPPIHLDPALDLKQDVDLATFRLYTKTGRAPDYLVWPPLFLHKDGPILAKGVVQPK